jgi:hypothetical protein
MFDVQLTDDDCYRICYKQDGIEACTTVSSAHLVEEKKAQLKAAVERQAIRAMFEPLHDA